MRRLWKPLFLLLTLLFMLIACQQQSPVTPADDSPDSLSNGLIEIKIEGLGSANLHIHSQAVSHTGLSSQFSNVTDTDLGFKLITVETFTLGDRTNGGKRYINAIYEVTNNTTAALNNLTLMGAFKATNTADTAISGLKKFDGSNAATSIAPLMQPSHGLAFDASSITTSLPVVKSNWASFQAFSETDTAAMPKGTASHLFPYGFVVHNAAGGRSLASGAKGTVSISAAMPLQSTAAEDPFSFSWWLKAVSDPSTRVTQGLNTIAADSNVEARADALGATTPITVLGLATPSFTANPSNRICTLRTAGSPASPTHFLVNETTGVCATNQTTNNTQTDIQNAINNASDGGTITFASSLDGQTIPLTSALSLTKDITFDASNLTNGVTFNNTTGHLFDISNDVNLTFDNIDFAGGNHPTNNRGDVFDVTDATGTLTIKNGSISGYDNTAIHINQPAGGDSFSVVLDNTTINGAGSSGEAVFVSTNNSSVNLSLKNTTINNVPQRAMFMELGGTGNHKVKVDNSTLQSTGNDAAVLTALNSAILEVRLVNGSSFTAGGNNDAINLRAKDSAQIRAFIDNVTLTPANRSGIFSDAKANSQVHLTLSNSQQSNTTNDGLLFASSEDTATFCANILNNTTASNFATILENQATFQLDGGYTNGSDVAAFLNGRNTFSSNSVDITGTFIAGTCTLPSIF